MMRVSTAASCWSSAVALSLTVALSIAGCASEDDPSGAAEPSASPPDQGADVGQLREDAESAVGQIASGDGLRVENKTGGPIALVFPNGDAAWVAAGKFVDIVRPCPDRLPLRAERKTGELIAERDGPCRRHDTWTVRDGSPRTPQLLQDPKAPVAPDLHRLVKLFVSYAVGNADSFPHWESVSMALGGQTAVSIDDVDAALTNRRIWRICPADWEVYGASSCPVDLLGPVINLVLNDAALVYSAKYADVTCAPPRTGRLRPGRLVVLRPSPQWRTCASDFALALVADEQGRLRSIDLTLSDP